MPQPSETRPADRPAAAYRIVVAGALDPTWSERTSGMRVVIHKDGDVTTTELAGHLTDQAALMGVIDRLYSYGAHLLSIECLSPRGDAEEAIPWDR